DLMRRLSPAGVSDEEVCRVAGLPEDLGVRAAWQLRHRTPDLARELCKDPLTHDAGHTAYILVCEVLRRLQAEAAPGQPAEPPLAPAGSAFNDASVKAMEAVARRARAGAGRRGRSPSSSDTEDRKTSSIDVCKALQAYGLEGLPLENFPKAAALQPLLRRARQKADHGRLPWVAGELEKEFEPFRRSVDSTLWKVEKGQEYASFAHGRRVGGAGASRSLFFKLRFLDLCHLAQESNVGAAYEFDRREWQQLATRIEDRGKSADPNEIVARVHAHTEAEVRDWVVEAEVACRGFLSAGVAQQWERSAGKGYRDGKGGTQDWQGAPRSAATKPPLPPRPPSPAAVSKGARRGAA
ncbi:unnamed protein product, partial [Prorocentrum cordatum]